MTIAQELKSLPVGGTRVILGVVVTRWSEGAWETGTWGRKYSDLANTVGALAGLDNVSTYVL